MRCGKTVGEGEEFCGDCAKGERAFEQGRSLWIHCVPVTDAIYRFKYHNRRCYGKIFAEELVRMYRRRLERWDIQEIIPVPLHRARKRRRGYNQSEVLARELGKILQIPVSTDVIFRIRNTRPQKDLDEKERFFNLKGAFGVSKKWEPKGNVLVVDDIYTTGSTIHNMAGILRKAGAPKVYFLTISIGQGI